jgi:3'-phosphoadenosine 5'-phosphosulfate sulfotransferase (PAPS reductase)/FAD synthetase
MKKHILNLSGKDSTALMLELIRRKEPLDEVVTFDTGWEFSAMYEHLERCKRICEQKGIKFVVLHPDVDFNHLAFEHITKTGKIGYSWCGGVCRWGTEYKTLSLDRYAKSIGDCVVYIGFAADEIHRLGRENNKQGNKKYPLIEWGLTEADCLQICYDAGLDFGGMYKHLDRVSCKYCRNKNLKELRNIRKYYPDDWEALKQFQSKTEIPFGRNNGCSIFDLEKRFAFEEERVAQGLSITNRDFHIELKKVMMP